MRSVKVINPAIQSAIASLKLGSEGEATNPAEDVQLEEFLPCQAWKKSCVSFLDLAFRHSEPTVRMMVECYSDERKRGMARPFKCAYYSLIEDMEDLFAAEEGLQSQDILAALEYIRDDSESCWDYMICTYPETSDEDSAAWAVAWDLGYDTAITLLRNHFEDVV